MCGIAGYIGEGDEGILRRMGAALERRGPDDEGFWQSKDQGAGFAFRRLAIIDVAGGHQPMTNEDSTVWVIFNGEIYNFKELRADLEVKGHEFKTNSDAEVIVHGYEVWGEEVFKKLWGMFAVAIYDTKTQKLLLARDRLGKKPLYYGQYGNTLVFGSEPKAILTHPKAAREIDLDAALLYFSFECVPTPLSIWKGMRKLEPGSYLTVCRGKSTTTSYWKLQIIPDDATSEREALDRLDALLRDATRRRLISDVPLGVFLSGGIDSSAIAWYAAQARQGIETFSVGFEDASYDESADAARVAKLLGTTHHTTRLTAQDALASIPQVYSYVDEPFADPSLIPTSLLARFARTRVTVALGGDGGDELFQGYPTFFAHDLAALTRPLTPTFLRTYLGEWIEAHASPRYMSTGFKLGRFLRGIGEKNILMRDLQFRGPFSPQAAARLLGMGEDRVASVHESVMSQYEDTHDALGAFYFRAYLMDQVMVKVDRASMMMSLEVRAPFLDHRVVEFVNRLPTHMKRKGPYVKLLLKKLMHGRLPPETLKKKKHGFALPIADWLRGELKDSSREIIRAVPLFDQGTAETLLGEHAQGLDRRKSVWALFAFGLWYDGMRKKVF